MGQRGIVILLGIMLLASCDLVAKETDPETVVRNQIWDLQRVLEADVPRNETATVSVLCVLDSTEFAAPVEDENEQAVRKEQALRRERVVAEELKRVMVKNRLIELVPPSVDQTEKAKQEMVTRNSAALSAVLATEIGQALAVEYLLSALIDREGREVYLAAQEVADGSVVFQETLEDWPTLVGEEEESEIGAE